MATQPDGSSLDPAFVAIGYPPPSEPTPVGTLTAASDLLATTFDGESLGTGKRTHPPIRLTAALPVGAEPVNAGVSLQRTGLLSSRKRKRS
jgi:hypothetical protein